MSARDGVLIGRIVIEKYATTDDVLVYVDQDNGSGDLLPLIDALGMSAFALAHFSARMNYIDEDDE